LRSPLDLRGETLDILLYEDNVVPLLLPVYADLSTATVTFTLYGDDGATVLTKTDTDGLEIQALKEINPTTTAIVDSADWSLIGFEPFTSDEWDDMATNTPCRYEIRYVIGDDEFAPYRGAWIVTKRIS
jgi:hypothetical protein